MNLPETVLVHFFFFFFKALYWKSVCRLAPECVIVCVCVYVLTLSFCLEAWSHGNARMRAHTLALPHGSCCSTSSPPEGGISLYPPDFDTKVHLHVLLNAFLLNSGIKAFILVNYSPGRWIKGLPYMIQYLSPDAWFRKLNTGLQNQGTLLCTSTQHVR